MPLRLPDMDDCTPKCRCKNNAEKNDTDPILYNCENPCNVQGEYLDEGRCTCSEDCYNKYFTANLASHGMPGPEGMKFEIYTGDYQCGVIQLWWEGGEVGSAGVRYTATGSVELDSGVMYYDNWIDFRTINPLIKSFTWTVYATDSWWSWGIACIHTACPEGLVPPGQNPNQS